MKKILFVDDESNVLQGLRRMLHPMREEWEMTFAQGGREALRILGASAFDVLVSDLRMPDMDGIGLLNIVRRQHPKVIRIILSGHVDEEMILRSVEPAHQYLSKPCDADTLKSAITRACALRDLLAQESLKRIISRVGRLPSVPSLYMELTSEIRSPDASMKRIAGIVGKDVAMSAKILQLVNSAFFGLHSRVSSIQHGVSILGLKTLRALVLTVQVFWQFNQSQSGGLAIEALMNHSMGTGLCARTIAEAEKQEKKVADYAFLAGLLHDVGKLVLATSFRKQYAEVLASEREGDLPVWQAEQNAFGATHAEVGAYLMGLWGIPDVIVEALAFHHRPSECFHDRFSPLTAVHVANIFEHERGSAETTRSPAAIDESYLQRLELLDRLAPWGEACPEAVNQSSPAE